ncbi:MAG: CheR family methyltransferase, partial [Chromatiaceae bacterium]
ELPPDTGMAYVLIQHLDPKHESMLTSLLTRTTPMPVVEATDGLSVEPNHVYVIPPNTNLGILHGTLHLMPRGDPHKQHLPVDYFLRSLAEDQGTRAIGVILSGTASDGALGLKAIKAEGGITLAQDPASAKYDGMPRSAIATGGVDFILPLEGIAKELARLAGHPSVAREAAARPELPPEAIDDLSKVFLLLRGHTGNDFTYYKQSTVQRRIKRRMLLHKLERLKDYVRFLQQAPGELDALFQDMLINVTGFFRDPETFEALKKTVFPRIMAGRSPENPIRIWAAGCSSGEEAYSVAIALLEFLGNQATGTPIQIFATDIDANAIDKARTGVYAENIAADLTPARLQRFFVRVPEGYQIGKPIRDMCVFAVQNVIKDPPFSRLDLAVCRNLLIYLGNVLQKKVLQVFHYALKPTGFLMLGTSETVGGSADLFALADRKNKIYTKKTALIPLQYEFAAGAPGLLETEGPAAPPSPAPIDIPHQADRIILNRYGPPGVIIHQRPQGRREDASRRRVPDRGHPGHPPPGASGRRASLPGPVRRAIPAGPGSRDRAGKDTGQGGTRPARPPGRGAGRRAGHQQGVHAVHHRGAGGDQRGAQLRQRGDPIGQRGAAVHQRGAGDRQGGAAVHQRGAGHGQR